MTPKAQLDQFIDRFTPEVAGIARAALVTVRALTPGAIELVYDNYNALVIGFSATDRASAAIVSIALYPRWVNLFFVHGATLPDPEKLLVGNGVQVRNVVLRSVTDIEASPVRALIVAALSRATVPLEPTNARQLIIRSVAPKLRDRRPKARPVK